VFNDAAIWKNLNSPRRLFLIAGPCAIESEKLCLQTAAALKKTCDASGIVIIPKGAIIPHGTVI
jgi:3-deoxy-D-manno-octulosonic acid (KDO) 8-phosphate synthase